MAHFKTWVEYRDQFMAEGLSKTEAAKKANEKTLEPMERVKGEQRSLEAEMEIEPLDVIFNWGTTMSPREVTDFGYVARMAYPRIEGIREILHRKKWSQGEKQANMLEAIRLMDASIKQALENRRDAMKLLLIKIEAIRKKGTPESYLEADALMEVFNNFRDVTAYKLLFPEYNLTPFKNDGTLKNLHTLFNNSYAKIDPKDYAVHQWDPLLNGQTQ